MSRASIEQAAKSDRAFAKKLRSKEFREHLRGKDVNIEEELKKLYTPKKRKSSKDSQTKDPRKIMEKILKQHPFKPHRGKSANPSSEKPGYKGEDCLEPDDPNDPNDPSECV